MPELPDLDVAPELRELMELRVRVAELEQSVSEITVYAQNAIARKEHYKAQFFGLVLYARNKGLKI